MTQRTPAYLWYPRDFDMDEEVKLMSYEEEGVYRRLLDHQWFHEGIPADVDKIARLVPKVPAARFRKTIWPTMVAKFTLIEGRLVNQKLERVRAELNAYSGDKSRAGKASAEARRLKHGTAQPPSRAPNTEPNGQSEQRSNREATAAEPAFALASAIQRDLDS